MAEAQTTGPPQARDTNKAKRVDTLRDRMIDLAFEEIYANGFLGLRVDTLLAKAKATKGAFYHHFASKAELGYAVIDEILSELADHVWGDHLANYDDPVEGIEATVLYGMQRMGPRAMEFGCPFNNLSQEMSAVDDGFRDRLSALFVRMIGYIADALRRGQAGGFVRQDIDVQATAQFIFAALEGTLSLVKTMGPEASLDTAMAGLRSYLATLRP